MKYELEQNYIIELLKCAITNTTPSTPDESLDWDVVFKYAKIHRVVPVLYFSIQKLPNDRKTKITNLDQYELAYKSNLVDDANRENEISIITKLLVSNEVDYILLKGSVTKHFYPDTSMRMMSDVDILYRNADSKDIKSLLESNGYTQTKSTPKDAMYLSSNKLVKVEMQQSLLDGGFTDWLKYLDTIWDRCENNTDNEYAMTPEDFYIYHIVHMAKHFINGGIGLRHVLDTWVIKNHYQDLDSEYTEKIFKELSLDKFENTITDLCKYWFEDNISSDKKAIDLISEYIFENGAFGNISQQSANEVATGSTSSTKEKIFPSKQTMANYYGDVITNHPSTIPFYWVRLTFERIFKNHDKTKVKIKSISNVSEAQKEKTKQLFEICGLK
ncbi:MAG: nucleotidyltransferase family protein [Eubacterium sp.]|nr:nucleotidyltransferase family protein [Eubacterium sp.]